MYQLFNNKILRLIPIVFLVVILLKITYTYNDLQHKEYEFAKKEAEVLDAFASTHRNYYQELFINKTIKLDAQTLKALPAYSSKPISELFSKNNPLNISLATVSDRARNKDNAADIYELQAINYFRIFENEPSYFKKVDDSFYHYASVLKIDKKCLLCHGKKSESPQFIQDKYDTAYDYKLGDVRGIVSIKIPVSKLNKYLLHSFYQSIVYDLILFIFLYIAIYFITKKSKQINKILEQKVEIKTRELKEQLIKDRLTRLPNRIKLLLDIQGTLKTKKRNLALLNIDRFKEINDFYGHDFADIVLTKLAQKIDAACKEAGIQAYKLPSDEFGVLSLNKMDTVDFYNFINTLLKSILETKLAINDSFVYLNISCGIANDETDLITKADMALQYSKKYSQKLITTYDASLDISKQITQNIDGIILIKDAITNDKIVPYYQPIYNVKNNKVQKYESLARILNDDNELILPSNFLSIAQKSNLYPFITKAMVTKSFAFFRDKNYDFSINLSIQDIQNKRTLKFLIAQIEDFPEPSRIIFEILESDKINNYEILKSFMTRIKAYGCQFAIDDFGSGYSNFSHIFELNADYLKIDASLVKYVNTDENSRIIVKTIINFASSLGLKTIAEFVEDKESCEVLEKMGVDYIQGFYIGKPSPDLHKD